MVLYSNGWHGKTWLVVMRHEMLHRVHHGNDESARVQLISITLKGWGCSPG